MMTDTMIYPQFSLAPPLLTENYASPLLNQHQALTECVAINKVLLMSVSPSTGPLADRVGCRA